MRKSDIAAQVAGRAPLTKAQAKSAVNAVFEVIRDALANGDTVSVIGFGRFSTKSRPARAGESIAIAASKAPSFTAGKALRDRLHYQLEGTALRGSGCPIRRAWFPPDGRSVQDTLKVPRENSQGSHVSLPPSRC